MKTITKEYLEANVVSRSSNSSKHICPDCGGNDLWFTFENGLAFCFNHAESYTTNEDVESDIEDARIESPHPDIEGIRSYYGLVADMYHSCLSEEHREYLNRRGLESSDIETYGIGFCPGVRMGLYDHPLAVDSGVARKDKFPALADRIIFQYNGEGAVTDLRGRIFRGSGMKYRGLFSSSRRRGAIYPYNYDRGMEKATTQGRIIITEGEMKAVLADKFGFPCVALPGMVSWRPIVPPPGCDVIVLFDNSKNPLDRMRVDRAIERVYMRMARIKVATLPLEREEKQDIDSFLLGKGDRARWFDQILQSSLPYQEYKKLRRF